MVTGFRFQNFRFCGWDNTSRQGYIFITSGEAGGLAHPIKTTPAGVEYRRT
jgi:hypothetical protein